RPVLDHALPAFLVRPLLGVGDCLDGLLPGAGVDAAVAAGNVGFGNLEIEHRLADCRVLGFHDLAGLVLVGGVQAGRLAGLFVHAIEHAAPAAPTDQTVTCLHGCPVQPRR